MTATDRWLRTAEQIACVRVGWRHRVRSRLAAGQETHGDRWTRMPLHELLREIQEEAEDLGGWGALTVQRLEHDDIAAAVPAHRRARISSLLQEIASLGAQADELAAQAIALARLP